MKAKVLQTLSACAAVVLLAGLREAALAEPGRVPGPSADPACFTPWTADTAFLQYPAREGPYRIALSNGLDTNDWRKQMLATASAYAARPDVSAMIAEFTIHSTGEDVAAQVGAIETFIDEGYDAIVFDAQDPTAFGAVIARANAAGIVLISFDNIVTGDSIVTLSVDQKRLGAAWAEWIVAKVPEGGRLLVVRGVPGATGDTERYAGITGTLDASGETWELVEATGMWTNDVAREATMKTLAGQPHVAGVIAGGGDFGVIEAMKAAGQPFVPFGGEDRNDFRQLCAEHAAQGLKCRSGGTGPAQAAVAIKVALAALRGEVVPQAIRLPLQIVDAPDFESGVNYFPDEPPNLFIGGGFPACDVDVPIKEVVDRLAQ